MEKIVHKMKRAIVKSQESRRLFSKKMTEMALKLDYIDEENSTSGKSDQLGRPASETEIQELEQKLSLVLPPSYKAFLNISNGWKVVDGSQNFFTIQQVLKWQEKKDPSNWISIAESVGNGFVKECLVVGASNQSPDKYLLNPKVIVNEEWQFIEYRKDGYSVFDSFLEFMIATKLQFDEAANEINLDDYFDPFESI
ncbi:MAG: SMI1/KNR4 family protein [Sediminibacterium sp.]|nr:SMI1/KNR4 family protein [Sediminibacterium sp.]